MDIGKRIKELRVENGYTQDSLAKKLSISRSTLACYETNKIIIPIDKLIMFAKFFDVTLDFLAGLED